MAFNKSQFRELIIDATLKEYGLYSEAASDLLMGTAAQESRFGTFLKQLGKGPALGVFQMEPATYNWLAQKYAARLGKVRPATDMIWDLKLATIMARLKYFSIPKSLPPAKAWEPIARYWKQYYNTPLGSGTVEEFLANVNRYVV